METSGRVKTMNDTKTDGPIEVMLEELQKAEIALQEAQAKVETIRSFLNDRLRDIGEERYDYSNGEMFYRVTRYKVAPIQVDFDGLMAANVLTPEEVNLFTEKKYNKKLLEQAVETGQIKSAAIVPFLVTPEEKYHVRFQAKPIPSDGSDGS